MSCSPNTVAAATYGLLCGTAGTGKTTLARGWVADGTGILCATTGIAAVNLGDATTINSLLGYYDTASLYDRYVDGHLTWRLRKLGRAGVSHLVLDEVSMLSGDQLTLLTKAVEEANGRGFVLGDDEDDYGDDAAHGPADRLRLTLVGDFAQLAPVKAHHAFTSPEWPRYAAHVCHLREVYRQRDTAFLTALQAVRRGDVDAALAYFGPRLSSETDPTFPGPTIFAKNDAVLRYNLLRLEQLPGPVVRLPAARWGKQRPEWGSPSRPPATWGIPPAVELKAGCLVMLLANHRDEPGGPLVYANGDLGVFLGLSDQDATTAVVQLQRTGEHVAVPQLRREYVIPLAPGRRTALRLAGEADKIRGNYELVGTVTYSPLRVAYASSCHKSQGLTLDAAQLNIRDVFWRTGGMLYVGLSRCRTIEGLRIVGTPELFTDRVRVDTRVREWL